MRYLMAIRAASTAALKQSLGERGSDDGDGRLAVAAEHGLEQIRLLSLGRKASRRPATLDVADQQGQVRVRRQDQWFRSSVPSLAPTSP